MVKLLVNSNVVGCDLLIVTSKFDAWAYAFVSVLTQPHVDFLFVRLLLFICFIVASFLRIFYFALWISSVLQRRSRRREMREIDVADRDVSVGSSLLCLVVSKYTRTCHVFHQANVKAHNQHKIWFTRTHAVVLVILFNAYIRPLPIHIDTSPPPEHNPVHSNMSIARVVTWYMSRERAIARTESYTAPLGILHQNNQYHILSTSLFSS